MSFSVSAPTSNYKQNRIIPGLASFINHDCDPNARYIVEGEKSASTLAIKSIKWIGAGEEISVTYGDNYFGENNETACTAMFVKKSEPRESNLDITQPLFKIFFGSDGSENDVSPAICVSSHK